ncbi:conserved unknown protein [Ectocarpus siliculosus]|uniref:ENTH domain-containing protein n=1 Tax=Ectocarpus siliculosus TaxID=2880 RepID=D7FUU7_ECTSI|nr:conserved unknown protein [Ectocarpus siliculosus]|eukprot:CBJ31753.1 conserved unknown protein [Ectocarpus siliculosus]
MNINKLRNKAEGLVTQLTVKDECEKRVLDAVSNNKYAAPRSLLNEVAEDTFAHDRYGTVMRLVWKTIDSPPRNWRSISKALVLVDHLVKHGAERVVADVQQHVHEIACLNEFRYVENMYDTGGGVREKARELVSLMDNPDLIQAQRRNARDLKSQYNGYGGDMPPRLSGGSGGGSRHPHDSSGGGGGSGRNSGEISDDWRAGYDRSPTPPQIDARRAVGGRSESIDFDEGREGYSGRLSRFQEQEKREAKLVSGGRRGSRDSAEGASSTAPRAGGAGGKGASASKKRTDGKKQSSGPDLLSGDDPFPRW